MNPTTQFREISQALLNESHGLARQSRFWGEQIQRDTVFIRSSFNKWATCELTSSGIRLYKQAW